MSNRYNYKYLGAGAGAGAENKYFQQQQRSMFLPIMLCSRSSLKDVNTSHRRRPSDEIGCAGQTKRSNKVTGFSPSTHPHLPTLNTKIDHTIKYQRLRRFFSGKSLCTAGTCDAGVDRDSKPVDLAELDPPLPVSRVPGSGQGRPRDNLWMRRSGEAATLKSLQVQSKSIHGGVEAKTV